jgi:hypothetical protein
MTKPSTMRHKTESPPMSVKEIRFAQLWIERDGTSTLAQLYVDAGFPAKATPQATEQAAWRIVKKRYVREFIRELQSEAANTAKVAVSKIAQGLAQAAFADRRQLWDERGRIRLPKDWPDEVAATVETVESREVFEWVQDDGLDEKGRKKPRRKELVGYVRKVRTSKRLDALKILAQWKQMLAAEEKDDGGENGSQDQSILLGVLGRLTAHLIARQPSPGGTGGVGGEMPVDPTLGTKPGATDPGVSQPGR